MCTENWISFPQQQDLKKLGIFCRRRQRAVIIHHTVCVCSHLSEQTVTLCVCMFCLEDVTLVLTLLFYSRFLSVAVCVKVCLCLCVCLLYKTQKGAFICSILSIFISNRTVWCCNQHVVIPQAALSFSHKHARTHTHTHTQAYIPEAQRQRGYCNKHLKKCWSNKWDKAPAWIKEDYLS